MALSQKHRSSIYQTLSPVIGEEEAEALLSQFPARDLDQPVTQAFVRVELAEFRAEMNEFRTEIRAEMDEMRAEMNEFRTEMRAEMNEFRTEMRAEMNEFRTEMRAEMNDLRSEMLALETRLTERMRQQTIWFMGALVSGMGLVAAIVAGLG